ncbi:MAG TPA: hypothetical protein VHZ78_08705 [Rhizomicrobium sp.]|jgi:hypothetical protein|nr:hypothetical protein [Rhizomicrobium sp.]
MSAIKPRAKVMAEGIPFVLTVDKAGAATASGPLWECTWTNRRGAECRRVFLESNLSLALAKKRGAK